MENGELRQNLAKIRKDMDTFNESSVENSEKELVNVHKLKQLEMKCAEQVFVFFYSY